MALTTFDKAIAFTLTFFFLFPSPSLQVYTFWDMTPPPFYFDDSKRMKASLDDLSFMLLYN